ncbi:Protein of unknown function [Chromohalobacter canadensis]|uniref:Lcl C-terminal domain-containing protein n=1 Tax=Chromohalobacter canadensis TaxID=141389 RepID=A0A285VQW5_9GAMM|nr:DUF1566 domain-containing protein [Chromohalobacter canadensis]SOC56464.1 Protein of unknown function [Chromohalobacter canadensis]
MAEQLSVTDPAFSEQLRALQTTDPAHPDSWNPQYQGLLENDHWLRAKIVETQGQVEDILGSDPINLSDQLDALVQYGAQRVFTERREQVPSHTITSAVSGDDSIDLDDTTGIEVGQHYFINDAGNVQAVRIAEVLSTNRVTLTTTLNSTVAAGSTLGRLAPGYYATPQLADMERGATIHAQGDNLAVSGWSGNSWTDLNKRADGGWDVPAGVDRLRVSGTVSRVAVISSLPISVTRRAQNITPADGDNGLTVTPTLQGTPYYPLYGVPQARRRFQIIERGGSFATPLYAGEEVPTGDTPMVEHVVATPLTTDVSYQWRYSDQNVEGEWAPWSLPTTFTTADTYVAAPTVVSPADGATEVPEQPIFSLSAFTVTNGEDTHAATSVRIKDSTGAVVWELAESATLNDIVVPAGVLQEGERTYTVEGRYHGETYGSSAWSVPASFTTEASFVPADQIGAAYGGGYTAGQIVSDYDGETYLLIVSDGGGDSVQTGAGTMEWRTAQSSVTTTHGVPPMTLADGRANHNAIKAAGALSQFPAVQWIENTLNAGAGLNGHTDWYLPARDELELIYRNFKPTTQDNNDGNRSSSSSYYAADGATHGTNANSLPEGAGYTTSDPAQTARDSFREGGADAFEASGYWSSTEGNSSGAWYQGFDSGSQYISGKTYANRVRAVRRVKL